MNELRVIENSNSNIQDENLQYLTFKVSGETLGISIDDVKEIIEVGNITRVPMTPKFIRGVINLRGNVVALIDLSLRMELDASELGKRSCIILVEINSDETGINQIVGMLVDQVEEILEISNKDVQSAPMFGSKLKTEFIQGMARVDNNFIILLEISKVLSVSELSQLSNIVNSTPAESIESD